MSRIAALLAHETAMAVRRLSKAPRFGAVTVLTLAAAAAPSLIFDLVRRAVLPPLPFERPHELVNVWQRVPWRMATSYPKLRYLTEHSRTMELAAQTGVVFFLDRQGSSGRLAMQAVTPNYFDVLRVRPRLGRTFREDDNLRPFEHPVVILSEALWRKRFGARPEVVGEDVLLNGRAFSVIGVMPTLDQALWGRLRASDAWVPAMMAPLGMLTSQSRETAIVVRSPRMANWLGVGRLRTGFDLRDARAEAIVLGREVKALWPDDNADVPFDVIRMDEDAVDPRILHAVSVLKVAGVLVLVLGGLNVGSLFLTRGIERSRALSVQALLGAPRLVLAWGPLSEAVLVGVAGGAAALLLTRGALSLLGRIEPSILTAPFGYTFDTAGWQVDWPLVSLSFVLSVATAVVCGLGPAITRTRREASGAWRSGSGVIGGGLRRLRLTRPGGLLVATEIAVALALTLPALLLARSLGYLVTADIGFRPQGVVMADLNLPTATHAEGSVPGFVADTTRSLRQVAGVEAASWVSCVPIDCGFFDTAVKPSGSRGKGFSASVHVVAPEAFRTLGIPLLRGRDFSQDDRPDGPRVAILSEDADRLHGSNTLGSRVDAGGASVEVVGIVGDVPYRDLAQESIPAVYFPLSQKPQTQGVLVIRSRRSPSDAAALLRRATTSLDPRLERLEVRSLDDRVERGLARFRGAAWLLGAAACLALFLAAVGTHGLLSSFVAQALPEIGIRIALGATRGRIGTTVATTALRLAAVGLLVGSALGMWGATYLRPYLFDVSPWDVRTLLLTLVLAAAFALLTALRPAQRASRSDPMAVLRCE